MTCQHILDRAIDRQPISEADALYLFEHGELHELGECAHQIRLQKHDTPQVTFVVDRNVNYSNVCITGCEFCAFARKPNEPDSYVLTVDQIKDKARELRDSGGTQLLIQGGHNPNLKINYYTEMFSQLKREFPELTVHSLSPSEIDYISQVSQLSLDQTIEQLQAAGLDSVAGAGAEILDDEVRRQIAPHKISTQKWLDIMEKLHQHGIKSTATMMFGHVETYQHRVNHMSRLRSLQERTGGFRAFICWTFCPDNTQMASAVSSRASAVDYLRTLAISRIFLHNFDNIQVSYVTQGLGVGQLGLYYGANDFGGTMMEENVVSAAGSQTSKSNREEIMYHIRRAGFVPVQRDTTYQVLH